MSVKPPLESGNRIQCCMGIFQPSEKEAQMSEVKVLTLSNQSQYLFFLLVGDSHSLPSDGSLRTCGDTHCFSRFFFTRQVL